MADQGRCRSPGSREIATDEAEDKFRIAYLARAGTALSNRSFLLLLSKDEIVVGIGSANMTSAGLGERLETWRYFTETDSSDLLAGIRSFLCPSFERKIITLY